MVDRTFTDFQTGASTIVVTRMTAPSTDNDDMSSIPDLTCASELPAHARIAHWLEQLIVSRRLHAGDKLPAELEMAATLGVSRMTLRQALSAVENKGLLERRRGRFGGNFVAQPRFDFNLSGLPGFTEQMRRAHVEAGALVVQATTRSPAIAVRTALGLRRGEKVHEVIRVRSANGDPVTLEETYFPAAVFPELLTFDLKDSLYRVMDREYGMPPFSADEVIEPVSATAQQAELLRVEEGKPLLMLARTTYAESGIAVEFALDYFRPDRTRITLHTQADIPSTVEVSPQLPKAPPASSE